MNAPVRILLACLALSACAVPKDTDYVKRRQSADALELGLNAAREACSLQRGDADSQIYCGDNLEAAGWVTRAEQSADPVAFLSQGPWRTAFDGRFLCGPASPATVLDSPAAAMACTQRRSGRPYPVLAAQVGGKLYAAYGIRPVEPVLAQAIGVMAGRIEAKKAAAPSAVATQREANRAEDQESVADYADIDRQLARGAQENRRGNYAAAAAAYRAAVTLQARILHDSNNPALAVPLARQAIQVSNQGRFAEADRLFANAQALAARQAQIDPLARPLVTHLTGLHELNRDRPQQALALLEEARRGFEAIVPPDALAARQHPSTGAHSAVEQMAQAAADASVLADQASSDALNGLIECRRYIAVALAALGRIDEAQKALDQARDLYVGRDPRLAARYYRTVGMTAVLIPQQPGRLSQLGLAVDAFARAEPRSAPLAQTELLHVSRYGEQGAYADAVPECRDAADILQERKAGVPANLLMPCLRALSLSGPAGDQAILRDMFALTQLAQGSITSRQIAVAAARLAAGARDPKVAEAFRQYDAATEKLEALARRRAELAADKAQPSLIAAIDEEMKKARDEQREAGEVRQAAAPGYGALVQNSVTAAEAQALLAQDEALAVVVLGDKEGWTLLLRKDRIFAGRIKGGAAAVDPLVASFRKSMALRRDGTPANAFDTEAAHGLYEAVLGPVADGMAGATALTVAPIGSLLSVPFGALLTKTVAPDAELAQAPFLVREVTVSHVPSAANFVSLRRSAQGAQAPRAWFGMGDFVPPTKEQAAATFPSEACRNSARTLARLPPLPGTRRELEAARELTGAGLRDQLLGTAFTAKAVLAAPLADYRIVHFATHAVLPSELGCQAEPTVLTSTPPGAKDALGAFLEASQIQDMNLNGVDLVILSACNTGGPNGTGAGAGESLSGLARAFFFAGAKSLLATHWDANDASATNLAALFIDGLQQDPAAGPAAALARAQRRMLDEATGPKAAQAHPFYWAVAALIGGRGAAPGAQVAASQAQGKRGGA